MYSRRKFIRTGGAALAAFTVASANGLSWLTACDETIKKKPVFGIQLYTLRDVIAADPKGILQQLTDFGYKHIESYEHGELGMFWGMGPAGFKNYLADLGMTAVASHCDTSRNIEQKAAEAAAAGLKYLICPWKGTQSSIDAYKTFADEFNRHGEICKKNGIRFAYHNHDYSFKPLNGQIPQDIMMANTDPALVDFEMDIYWVVTAGQDPIHWLKKYKDRFRLCHIKDRSKTPGANNGDNSVDLGTGAIDFAAILKTAKEQGMDYYIMEQEAYPNGSPVEAARVGMEYLKQLKL